MGEVCAILQRLSRILLIRMKGTLRSERRHREMVVVKESITVERKQLFR
jgi:hypothetical protein